MYKAWLFILLVCCVKIGKSEKHVFPETEIQQLYQKLALAETVSYQAFQQALRGYNRYIPEKPLLVVIDYSRPSTGKRMCVIDLSFKQVLFESHVAHGRNSGENYAVSFSNEPGSYKSSLGFFHTAETYYGRNGYSLMLDGLEKGRNDKARERAIVVHGAPYADPGVVRGQGRLGRSLGCPALPPAVSKQVIDTIKEGALLYIYGIDRTILTDK